MVGQNGGVRILNYKSVFIGEDCYFDTLAPECIIIENNVLITKGCSVLTHYYDFKQKSLRMENNWLSLKNIVLLDGT